MFAGGMFTYDELGERIATNHVTGKKHPTDDLVILCYSQKTQYEWLWDKVTTNCRGLILNKLGDVVARPFGKFFNMGESTIDQIAFDKPPVVYDKLDGSLGIIYKSSRGYEVATKGSFVSEHAEWATKWLNDHYPTFSQPDNVTTLVEIISPDLRICLDYGSREELVLIAAIDNETGEDIPIHKIDWWPGTVVQELTLLGDMHKAAQYAQSAKYADREGIVMVWPRAGESAYRLKVKHPEYVRLHGIITNFSVKKVWEVLADGGDFLALLESVPDEFYQLVHSTVKDLHQQHDRIWATAAVDYANIAHHKERAEFAVHAKLTTYPGLVFALRDGKNIEPMVWKMIKPTGKTQLP